MYVPHTVIFYLGCVFFAIGISFLLPVEHLAQSNINFSIIPSTIFGATVSSLLLTCAELLKEVFIRAYVLKKIQKLLENKFESELDLYQTINECYIAKIGIIRTFFLNIANLMYCFAIPLAIALMLTIDLPSNNTLTGITVLTFGLIISLLGLKEQNNTREKILKNDLFYKFYKEKSEKMDNNHA